MGFLTTRKANAHHPQVVTLVIDDSGSMKGDKAKEVTERVQDLVIKLQAENQGTGGFRFLLNLGKFGDMPSPLAVSATPLEVNLTMLNFTGSSGETNMAAALQWAEQATHQALGRCRSIPGYREDEAPNPICIFFSDGENTGPDVSAAAAALQAIPFQGGRLDVVACGIGMESKDYPVMQKIASSNDLATNIPADRLGDFIAGVEATLVKGESPQDLVRKQGGL